MEYGYFKGTRWVRGLIFFRNPKVFLILISVLFLGGCSQGRCCDTDIEKISQTSDLQYLTYTIRVRYSIMCDVRKVKVEVEIPISLKSEKAPGETWKRTHSMGRLKARESKRNRRCIIS